MGGIMLGGRRARRPVVRFGKLIKYPPKVANDNVSMGFPCSDDNITG
jgi:hypothetical protein